MRKTGPAVAALITAAAIAGAAIAQANTTHKAAPKPLPRPALACPATPTPVPPAADPTGVAPLVPPYPNEVLICQYGSSASAPRLLTGVDGATLAYLLDSTVATPNTATAPGSCTAQVTGKQYDDLVILRYGLLKDVAVLVATGGCDNATTVYSGLMSATASPDLLADLDGIYVAPSPTPEAVPVSPSPSP